MHACNAMLWGNGKGTCDLGSIGVHLHLRYALPKVQVDVSTCFKDPALARICVWYGSDVVSETPRSRGGEKGFGD
jgi:hypothetical protein